MSIWKRCSRCGEVKFRAEFSDAKGRQKDGKMAWCKWCMRDYAWRRSWAQKLGLDMEGINAFLRRAAESDPGR